MISQVPRAPKLEDERMPEMPLFVAELETAAIAQSKPFDEVLSAIEAAAAKSGGEFIESQVTADHARVFAVIEHADQVALRADLTDAGLTVDDLAQVRLDAARRQPVAST